MCNVAGMLWTLVGFAVVLALDALQGKTKKQHLNRLSVKSRLGYIAGCTQAVRQKNCHHRQLPLQPHQDLTQQEEPHPLVHLHIFCNCENIKQKTWKFDPASQVLSKYHQWIKFWKQNNLLVLDSARDPSIVIEWNTLQQKPQHPVMRRFIVSGWPFTSLAFLQSHL